MEDNTMTDEQKHQIETRRIKGEGYSSIAEALGLSKDTIKSYCRRKNMGGIRAAVHVTASLRDVCPQCGEKLVQLAGRKQARFCSSTCRQTWWNAHPDQVKRKAVYSFTCAYCGKAFSAYGNSHRKYCSHDCYSRARFKRGASA